MYIPPILEETNSNSRRIHTDTHTCTWSIIIGSTDSYVCMCVRRRTRENSSCYTAQLYKRRVQPCRMKRMRMYREKKKKRKERVLIAALGRRYI